MNERVWRKISYFSGLLAVGSLFGLVAYMATLEIKDFDIWLHIAAGKFITLNHIIPRTDILSCSLEGKPWINHEWLFQVIVYNIFKLWGADGLLTMQATLVVVTMMVLLFLGYNKDRQLITIFGLYFVFLLFQQRFTTRPDLYSLLFFALYIFILALYIDRKWSTIALFVIQVLWVNIHGFFFFGPLFVLIGLISEWLKRSVRLPYEWNESGRLTNEEYKRLKQIFFLVILASLLNPHFLKGALYPLGVFFSLSQENKIFFNHIQELQRPVTWDTLFAGGQFFHYKAVIFFSLVSFVFNRRRIDISALFLWLVFLFFSLLAARNIAFFGFAAYLVFITNVVNISYKNIVPLRFTTKKFQSITSTLVKIVFLLSAFHYGTMAGANSYYDFDKYELKSELKGISLRSYPVKAADFLLEHNVQGDFFNDFNSGAYLLGRCFPNIKVFIDGRTEFYGGEFFKQYQEILDKGNMQLFEAMVSRYKITGVFLNSVRQHIPQDILKYLYAHKEWRLIYFDYDAVIFLRVSPENAALIEKFAIDLNQWQPKKLDIYRLGPANVIPFQHYYRAYTLDTLEFYDQALAELEEALKINPSYAQAHELIGKIYAGRKDFQKAFEHFRLAALNSFDDKEVRFNLALSYFDLTQYEGAVKQYESITQLWPQDPKGFFFLAKSYATNKQNEEAMETLKKAHQLDPRDVMDILKIGDIFYEQKQYLKAKEAFELALNANKPSAAVHEKLASVYEALENKEKAKDELKKAITIEPESQELKKKLEALGS